MSIHNRWTKTACLLFVLALTGCDTIRSIKSDFQSSKAFDRKVRCETYASKTEQEFKEAERELKGGKTDIYFSAERMFYSAKRNSCICILRASYMVRGQLFEDVQTLDVLTKEDL